MALRQTHLSWFQTFKCTSGKLMIDDDDDEGGDDDLCVSVFIRH